MKVMAQGLLGKLPQLRVRIEYAYSKTGDILHLYPMEIYKPAYFLKDAMLGRGGKWSLRATHLTSMTISVLTST